MCIHAARSCTNVSTRMMQPASYLKEKKDGAMGKKGDALRAKKAKAIKYYWSDEDLEAHDKLLLETHEKEFREKMEALLKTRYEEKEAELAGFVKKEWDSREAIFDKDNFGVNFMTLISMLLAVSSRVLVEQFGWMPIPKDRYFTKRYKLARFGDAVVNEINAICTDTQGDIRKYCDEVYELYGVKFISEEDNEEAAGDDTSKMP